MDGKKSQPSGDHNYSRRQSQAYIELSQHTVRDWWTKVDSSKQPPTKEQRAFLKDVITRYETEERELKSWEKAGCHRTANALRENARTLLLGMPGGGKTHCLLLLRVFFESCLGLAHGIQFQFFATQNTMAELIGGGTVHTWGCIPINKVAASAKATAKDADWDQLFENALNMRWLIID